jgi:hypothetical protein
MILSGMGIARINYADRLLELGDAFNEVIEFADSLLRCESEVFQCERQIYAKLGRSGGCGTGFWVEEIILDLALHGLVSIPRTTNSRSLLEWTACSVHDARVKGFSAITMMPSSS